VFIYKGKHNVMGVFGVKWGLGERGKSEWSEDFEISLKLGGVLV
jgi:hypothetical protein